MWTVSARAQYRRSGDRYASDMTDAEFALIARLLPASKRGGRPRSTSARGRKRHFLSAAQRLPVAH